jgi:DNA-binding response OmpR family regulator
MSTAMPHRPLAGRLILIVEDDPLIALDVISALRMAGAKVLSAGYLEAGLFITEHPDLSAAVIDLHLRDSSGIAICRRLLQRRIPFVIYTGYPQMLSEENWSHVHVIVKPARREQLVAVIASMLKSRGENE